MRRAILAAFLLSACASTPERYGYDGARPAGAPAFRPELDAPHQRGQPGQIDPERKTLPPSPNKRPYEPRLDGNAQMMAADDVSRSQAVTERLQSPPPTPEGLPDAAWATCWGASQTCLLGDPRAVRASLPTYGCLREMFASACGGWIADRGENGYAGTLSRYGSGPYDVGAIYDATRKRKAKACKDVNQDDAFKSLYESLYRKCSRSWMNDAV